MLPVIYSLMPTQKIIQDPTTKRIMQIIDIYVQINIAKQIIQVVIQIAIESEQLAETRVIYKVPDLIHILYDLLISVNLGPCHLSLPSCGSSFGVLLCYGSSP